MGAVEIELLCKVFVFKYFDFINCKYILQQSIYIQDLAMYLISCLASASYNILLIDPFFTLCKLHTCVE